MRNGYYSGALIKDNVMEDYLQGKYYDKSTKSKVSIPEKVSKRNVQYMREINDLTLGFIKLLHLSFVIEGLLQSDGNIDRGDVIILYRLRHAWSGTINYNKSFKYALGKYSVFNDKIDERIKVSINAQRGRVIRNEASLYQLLDDYGVSFVRDEIEEKTGKSMIDAVYGFCEDSDRNPQTSDDYREIDLERIDWIKSEILGADITVRVSDSLKKHREYRNSIAEKVKQERRDNSRSSCRSNAYSVIDNDNVFLQNDLDRCTETEYAKLNATFVKNFIRKVSSSGGQAFYIALCKKTVMRYMDNDGNITTSARQMKLFDSEESANRYLEEVKESNQEVSKCFTKVMKLVASANLSPDLRINSMYMSVNNALLSAFDDEDGLRSVKKKALIAVQPDRNSFVYYGSFSACFYIVRKPNTVDSYYLGYKDGKYFMAENVEDIVFVSLVDAEMVSADYICSLLGVACKVERYRVDFSVLSKYLEVVTRNLRYLSDALNTRCRISTKEYGLPESYICSKYKFRYIRSFSSEVYKYEGHMMYVLLRFEQSVSFFSRVSNNFESNLANVCLFDNYGVAFNLCMDFMKNSKGRWMYMVVGFIYEQGMIKIIKPYNE